MNGEHGYTPKYSNSVDCIKTVAKHEGGLRTFYSGLRPFFTPALRVSLFHHFMDELTLNNQLPSFSTKVLVASVATLTVGLTDAPIEAARIQMIRFRQMYEYLIAF